MSGCAKISDEQYLIEENQRLKKQNQRLEYKLDRMFIAGLVSDGHAIADFFEMEKLDEPEVVELSAKLEWATAQGNYALIFAERTARTCYKSEDKIDDYDIEKTKKFVRGLITRGHEAMLEHLSATVRFVIDRGVSHELVRHRLASFAQESTRYVNYSGGKIQVVMPENLTKKQIRRRKKLFAASHIIYNQELEEGLKPEIARGVLPTALKTEIVVTANFREWRHIFKLRAIGTTGKPHPQMKQVMLPLLAEFQKTFPVFFDDITGE